MPKLVNTWRKKKRQFTKQMDAVSAGPMIEALYKKKYAEPLLACSQTAFCDENVMFIISVNLVEHMMTKNAVHSDHGLDEFDWIPKFYHYGALMIWILDTFVRTGVDKEINLSSKARRTTLKPTSSVLQLYRRLEFCRNDIAKVVAGDAVGWQNQVPYIKQLWSLNTKLSGQSKGDVGPKIRTLIDRTVPPLPPTDKMR